MSVTVGKRVVVAGATALCMISTASAASSGHYTSQQAKSGQKIYSANCSSCHGSNLQGGAGPALAGSAFAQSLKFSNMSATQLFNFISEHMPANNPGSLSHKQYLKVVAYLLSKNGYPSGNKKLTEDALKQVNLLPYPGGKKSSQNAQ